MVLENGEAGGGGPESHGRGKGREKKGEDGSRGMESSKGELDYLAGEPLSPLLFA